MLFTPAYAQSAGAASAGGGAALLTNIIPLILIFVIFWFFLIRPQQKQMKDHRAKIDAVKKGDQVVTGGGLYGKVTKVEADALEIEIAPGIKVKSVKSMLTDVLTATPAKPAND